MLRYWPILFLLFPALELYVLIRIGSKLGALATLALLIASTMAGIALLKIRGARILARFQEEAARGAIPSSPIFETLCLMAAGWLFIFPGFISDGIALLLLIPQARRGIGSLLRNLFTRGGFKTASFSQSGTVNETGKVVWTCDGDPHHTDPLSGNSHPQSAHSVVIDCESHETTTHNGQQLPPEHKG